jgi:hypothetical protein
LRNHLLNGWSQHCQETSSAESRSCCRESKPCVAEETPEATPSHYLNI